VKYRSRAAIPPGWTPLSGYEKRRAGTSGVGYDIGCGNKAVLTDADAADVRANIARIMDDVWSTISFGLARKNKEPVDHELFDDNNDDAWQITQGANSAAWRLTSLRDMARAQLGTVGSGNHYVDIFEDEHGRIWVGLCQERVLRSAMLYRR
jgi:tRNA-splicing ligase RtcB